MGDIGARIIVLDLETYKTRDQRIIERLAKDETERRPPHNEPKANKEKWDTPEFVAERVAEVIADTSKDPALAEPLCCAFITDDTTSKRNPVVDIGFDHFHEREGLLDLSVAWDDLAGPETIWVGHNICGYDLPVLLNRWRRHRVTPPTNFPSYVNGRWHGRIYDTMLRFPSKTPYIKLELVCDIYGIKMTDITWRGEPMDGSRVASAYEAGEIDIIKDYCLNDVYPCRELYLAMTAGDRWGTYDARNAIAEQIAIIEHDETLTQNQKRVAVFSLMDQAGLIPRVAA